MLGLLAKEANIIRNGIYLYGADNYTAYIPLPASFVTVDYTTETEKRGDKTFTFDVFTFLPDGPKIRVQPNMVGSFYDDIVIEYPKQNVRSFYMAGVKAHTDLSAALRRMQGKVKVNEVITKSRPDLPAELYRHIRSYAGRRRKTRRGQRPN